MTLVALPATGQASVQLGQLASAPSTGFCAPDIDRVEPAVTSGKSYVVPGDGTITSWSTNAGPNANQQMTLKVFRPIGPGFYKAVAHDAENLDAGQLDSFPVAIGVKAGDVLGLNQPNGAGQTYCDFPVLGDAYPYYYGDLADGESADFIHTQPDERLNIAALLAPSHAIRLGSVRRNTRRGTAMLKATVPGPGKLTAKGKHIRARISGAVVAKSVTGPGRVKISIKAVGKGLQKLRRSGRLSVKLSVSYRPQGGTAKTVAKRFTLEKHH